MSILNFSEIPKNHQDKILLFLFCSFPIALIAGNLIINIYIILIGLIHFIFNFNKSYFKNNIFIILNILFLSLIINLIFSQNIVLSYPRVLKFLFIIYFVLSFGYLANSNKFNLKNIYNIWLVIFLFFTIDIIIEYVFGKNIFGMKAYMPGRLSGLFGEELVAGYFFFGFVFLMFSHIYENFKPKRIIIFAIFIFIKSLPHHKFHPVSSESLLCKGKSKESEENESEEESEESSSEDISVYRKQIDKVYYYIDNETNHVYTIEDDDEIGDCIGIYKELTIQPL